MERFPRKGDIVHVWDDFDAAPANGGLCCPAIVAGRCGGRGSETINAVVFIWREVTVAWESLTVVQDYEPREHDLTRVAGPPDTPGMRYRNATWHWPDECCEDA